MPLPLILAGANLALQGLSIGLGHSAAEKQARASREAARRMRKETTDAANRSAAVENEMLDLRLEEQDLAFKQHIDGLSIRRSEEEQAGRRSILATNRAAKIADGQARLSAGAAGVAGASVTALLNDVETQAANTRLSIDQNVAAITGQIDRQEQATRDTFSFQRRQTEAERKVIEANRANRIAGVQNIQTDPRPNPLATALQLGGALLNFGTEYLNYSQGPRGGGVSPASTPDPKWGK